MFSSVVTGLFSPSYVASGRKICTAFTNPGNPCYTMALSPCGGSFGNFKGWHNMPETLTVSVCLVNLSVTLD